MPRTAKKELLSHAERSRIAKERWARIRAKVAESKAPIIVDPISIPAPVEIDESPILDSGILNAPTVTIKEEITIEEARQRFSPSPEQPPVAPVPKKPKQKRTVVPKEFLLALKTADQLLAKALEEYEHCEERMTYLRKAIPRLQRTVQSLRSESNPDAQAAPNPYDFSGSVPNATAFQAPISQFASQGVPNLSAIQAAMAAPPASRAQGGAMQFSPDVLGSLEGPDDDGDIDRFITGPAAGGSGWIGG